MAQVPPLIADSTEPGVTQVYDRSLVGARGAQPRFLLLGPALPAASLPEDQPTLAPSAAEVVALAGRASCLHEMVKTVLAEYPKAECWIAWPGDDSVDASTAVLTFAAAPTAAGTWSISVGGRLYQVAVAKSATVTDQAAAFKAAINADLDAVCTANNAAGVLTLTAKCKGAVLDGLSVVLNPGGATAGHITPAGGSITEFATNPYLSFAGGGAIPSFDGLITALADDEYDVIVSAYHDSTTLGDIKTEIARRWLPEVNAPFGVFFTAKRDTRSNLQTWGDGIAEWRALGASVEPANPASPWVHAAAWAAVVGAQKFIAQALTGRPLAPHTGMMGVRLTTIPATPSRYRFTKADREGLTAHGVATTYTDTAGAVHINNEISTEAGAFVQEVACAMAWQRYERSGLWRKFAGLGVVDDELDEIPAGCVAPKSVRAEILSLAKDAVGFGWLRNMSQFVDGLQVEPAEGNDHRINVIETPRWSKSLRQLGIVIQPQG